MEEKDEYGISYDEIIATLSKYITTHNEVINQASSHSYQQYPTNYPLIGMDDLTNLVNGGYSQGIANQVATAGTTTTIQYSNPKKEKEYTLTRDKGYFIYWLMMNFAFLEDHGFKSNSIIDPSKISTGWGRALLHSGKYNNTDKAFLQEVSEWMKKKDWVYKKPILNEHNDTLPLIERLPIHAMKL